MGKVKKKSKADLAYEKLKDAKITKEWNQVKAGREWKLPPEDDPNKKPDLKKGETADWDQIREAQNWQQKMLRVHFSKAKTLKEVCEILDAICFMVQPDHPEIDKLKKYLETK